MSESSNNSKRVAQADITPISKKVKSDSYPLSVLTFTSNNDNFARLELLSSHTLFHLVDALCKHTPVGYEGQDGVDDHLWNIHYRSKATNCNIASERKLGDMNLTIGSTMRLEYDFGSTTYYEITLVDSKQFEGSEEAQSSYPRNNPKSTIPSGFERYVPSSSDVNLDTLFPSLQKWIFGGGNEVCSVHLFQPGRKQNFGFMDKNDGARMLYLPVKPSNLMNWIGYFEEGAKKEPKRDPEHGHFWYTWHSVVIIPRLHSSEKIYKKYKGREPGFTDSPVVNDISVDQLTGLFPKIAALAGCVKDKKVKKGWINFHKRNGKCALSICCGNAVNHPKLPISGVAFDGQKQHDPVDEPLFSITDIEINGLHDLFCVVEGLLMTL